MKQKEFLLNDLVISYYLRAILPDHHLPLKSSRTIVRKNAVGSVTSGYICQPAGVMSKT